MQLRGAKSVADASRQMRCFFWTNRKSRARGRARARRRRPPAHRTRARDSSKTFTFTFKFHCPLGRRTTPWRAHWVGAGRRHFGA